MAEFTYKLPDEKIFFSAVMHVLSKGTKDKEKQIAEKLKGGKCSIDPTSQFSGERWNAYRTEVHFYVPIDSLEFFDKETINILLNVCDRIMPKDVGYDIQSVVIAPTLDGLSTEATLASDLEEIQNSVSNNTFQLLPDDIKDKGKEMSEVYVYLYCVENSLRLFIERIFTTKIGEDYISKIVLSTSVKKSIQARKEMEAKNQWIGIRGNSDLFYLDFKELASVIINNWELFKEYFPDQHWLNVKIEELGNCRNLIAHNSYVGSLERDVIRLNYNQILKQINNVQEKKATQVSQINELDDLPF